MWRRKDRLIFFNVLKEALDVPVGRLGHRNIHDLRSGGQKHDMVVQQEHDLLSPALDFSKINFFGVLINSYNLPI